MGSHPIILALWFALEIALLFALGYWGWTTQSGLLRPLLGLGLPILAAALWGIFRVPGEPGDAPVAVPGFVRLLLELALFGTGVLLLAAANQPTAAAIFGLLIILTYALSYDRVLRLLKKS